VPPFLNNAAAEMSVFFSCFRFFFPFPFVFSIVLVTELSSLFSRLGIICLPPFPFFYFETLLLSFVVFVAPIQPLIHLPCIFPSTLLIPNFPFQFFLAPIVRFTKHSPHRFHTPLLSQVTPPQIVPDYAVFCPSPGRTTFSFTSET